MKKQTTLFIGVILFLMCCGKVSRLSVEDRLWMPYKGDETLIFKSNKGQTDTIFLLRKDTLWGYPDPALSANKYEITAVFCKHSDSYTTKSGHRYLQNYFLKIRKTMSENAELVISLSAYDAKFYNLRPIKIDSLNKEKSVIIKTSTNEYKDVYIIQSDDYAKDYSDRSNFVTKLYWSKSSGLVRYDKNDGLYWELLSK